jgi:hypothetical protein
MIKPDGIVVWRLLPAMLQEAYRRAGLIPLLRMSRQPRKPRSAYFFGIHKAEMPKNRGIDDAGKQDTAARRCQVLVVVLMRVLSGGGRPSEIVTYYQRGASPLCLLLAMIEQQAETGICPSPVHGSIMHGAVSYPLACIQVKLVVHRRLPRRSGHASSGK